MIINLYECSFPYAVIVLFWLFFLFSSLKKNSSYRTTTTSMRYDGMSYECLCFLVSCNKFHLIFAHKTRRILVCIFCYAENMRDVHEVQRACTLSTVCLCIFKTTEEESFPPYFFLHFYMIVECVFSNGRSMKNCAWAWEFGFVVVAFLSWVHQTWNMQ